MHMQDNALLYIWAKCFPWPPAESEEEEAEEEDPSWLISSSRRQKNQQPINPHPRLQHDDRLSNQHGHRVIARGNSANEDDASAPGTGRNLHSAVRSCVNQDTFDDLLRLAGQNSANGGNYTKELWRKGSLDSTNGHNGNTSAADFSHQVRKSSAPEPAARDTVVLRFPIRRHSFIVVLSE